MKIFFFLEQKNFDGLLPILWTGHAGAQAGARGAAGCAGKGAGRAGAGRGCRRGRAGVGPLGVRAGRAGRARSRRACVGRPGCVGERHGMGARSAGGRGAGRAGARAWAAVTRGRARARGARMGERYCSSNTAGPRATIRPLCAPGCAQLGQIWVLGTLTRFFALFDLLSHQMNTVHCVINFLKKKIYFFKYLLNSNKIK